MGNKPSIQTQETFEEYLKSFKFETKYIDPRLGEIKTLRSEKEDIVIFQKDYITNSGKDFQRRLDEINLRSAVEHPNIIRTVGYTSKTESAFCTNHYKISTFIEAFDSDLQEDLDKKTQQQVILFRAYNGDSLISLFQRPDTKKLSSGVFLTVWFQHVLICRRIINFMEISDHLISWLLQARSTKFLIATFSTKKLFLSMSISS